MNMAAIPSGSAPIASTSLTRIETSAPGTTYAYLVSDWARPPKDLEINAAHKQQLSADQRRRNEVEGVFGSGKRKYSLRLIMARLTKGAETLISMGFLVMCAEKILRLLRLFFVTIFAWICSWQWPGTSWVVLRNIFLLETAKSLVTA